MTAPQPPAEVQPPADPPKPGPPPAKGDDKPAEGPHGYPENTPVAEMSDRQAAAYWRHKARGHEDARKAVQSELAALKPKAEQYDELEAASKTEQERAVENAKKEAADQTRKEVEGKAALALVGAEFRAAAKGVLSAEALAGLLEDLDRSKYVQADGTVDLARIEKRVGELAPKAEKPPVDLGQGQRRTVTAKGVDAGRQLFADRKKARPATTT